MVNEQNTRIQMYCAFKKSRVFQFLTFIVQIIGSYQFYIAGYKTSNRRLFSLRPGSRVWIQSSCGIATYNIISSRLW